MTEIERYAGTTPFQIIYDAFFNLVTDDMYLEWEEQETIADIKNIFLASLTNFEFPRFKLYGYSFGDSQAIHVTIDQYDCILDQEEINIFANLMIIEWTVRQLATVDVTRQRYSSKDFAFTSQANHLAKLIDLKQNFMSDSKRLQRLYKRRLVNDLGYMEANYAGLGGKANAN